MVLIISHKSDVTTDYVVTGLQKKRVKYHRYNTEDILTDQQTSIALEGSTQHVEIRGLSEFRSVLYRRTKTPEMENGDQLLRQFVHEQSRSLLNNLWCSLQGVKWVSSPFSIYVAENKLYQLRIAQQSGLRIPQTLVSTSPEKIQKFCESQLGGVVAKPLTYSKFSTTEGRKYVFTSELSLGQKDRVGDYLPVPTIFQEKIEKEAEFRVTVVGNEVFAARIDSQTEDISKIDCRRGKLKFKPTTLPADLVQKMLILTHTLGLRFGAVDLALTPNGDYVFFEINPVGQFVWIELQTGQPITDRLIDELSA